VGPGFSHYRPNFSALLNFAGPILKLFVWAVKKRPKTSPTYKIETLTLWSAHIFKTRHPAVATAAEQPLEQASRPASRTSRQAGRPAPASRTSRQALRPAARQVHGRQHLQAAELSSCFSSGARSSARAPYLLQLLAVLVRRPSAPAGPAFSASFSDAALRYVASPPSISQPLLVLSRHR
jgi:hypothetical protein